jgi:hypothetical protein
MTEKREPGASFPSDDVRATLRQALDSPEKLRDLRIALTVSGGMPDERYDLRFVARGDGEVACGLDSGTTPAALGMQSKRLSVQEMAGLIDRMRLADLLETDVSMPRIPPDSLVGRIEIAAQGGEPLVIYFMADESGANCGGCDIRNMCRYPGQSLEAALFRSGGARMAWLNGKKVDALWSNEQESNVHAWIDGAWRKFGTTTTRAPTSRCWRHTPRKPTATSMSASKMAA